MSRRAFPFTLAGPMRRQAAGVARQLAVAALLSLAVVAGLSAQATTPAGAGAAEFSAAPTDRGAIVLAAVAP